MVVGLAVFRRGFLFLLECFRVFFRRFDWCLLRSGKDMEKDQGLCENDFCTGLLWIATCCNCQTGCTQLDGVGSVAVPPEATCWCCGAQLPCPIACCACVCCVPFFCLLGGWARILRWCCGQPSPDNTDHYWRKR